MKVYQLEDEYAGTDENEEIIEEESEDKYKNKIKKI
jgi:hypothetical protein